MRRILSVAVCLCLTCAFLAAEPERPDGKNEILAVVNGEAITYQEVVGDQNLQAEINSARAFRNLPPSVTDGQIERELVYSSLQTFILNKLLDAEADRVQLKITDAQMRAIINAERKSIGLDETDAKAWATYLKEEYALTPAEYREKRRTDIRRNEILNYMSGLYGPLPPQYPLEVYFELSVKPAEVRKEYEATAETWRIAKDIDYREFRLIYPADKLSLEEKRKLVFAAVEGDNSVRSRVLANESLEKASESLKAMIEEMAVPGLRMEMTDRQTAPDDRDLDPTTYQLVLQVPLTGGVSLASGFDDRDENGQRLEGIKFVQVFSRKEGDRRDFESPKVQEAIRIGIQNQRLVQNRAKVEQALMKRAAIVPERNFKR